MSGAQPAITEQPAKDHVRSQAPTRLGFVDALRVTTIVLVIAHHAGQAYGPTGGNWPVSDQAVASWLGPFFAVNAAFFMGLMFFLAGYFVPGAIDRKGLREFGADRWRRIGIPLVCFVLLVHVPLVYQESGRPPVARFVGGLLEGGWQDAYLHLWFLAHLLLYSGVYAAWRAYRVRVNRPAARPQVPNDLTILAFAVGLALLTWVIRWDNPIDVWRPLLLVVPAEIAHLPQYVLMFTAGTLAFRGNWLSAMTPALGRRWLSLGALAALGLYSVRLLYEDSWRRVIAGGGRSWQSLLYSGWESLIAVGLVVGLLIVSRDLVAGGGRLRALAELSFPAYLLHFLLVIAIQMAFVDVSATATVKFLAVTSLSIVASFGLAHVLRYARPTAWILGVELPQRPMPS